MRPGIALLLGVLLGGGAGAHSASDAYLTLTVETSQKARVLHGQWDIAVRDLDFVLDLAERGQGQVTWGAVRSRRTQIETYAYRHLRFATDAAHACALTPLQQMIDQHADGTYAVLLFDVVCGGGSAPITLDYSLFFDLDPSHRAIFIGRNGKDAATAVLSPQNAKIKVN
jgi:hypothetical protein